jgi:hypothetical protein
MKSIEVHTPVLPLRPKPGELPEVLTLEIPRELVKIEEEKQVIVHCSLMAIPGSMIRIWPTTYLISQQGGDKIPLAHAENITYAPRWTLFEGAGFFTFTLIFKGLPSECISFDLVEEAHNNNMGPEELQLFTLRDIQRNETDVYHVWI